MRGPEELLALYREATALVEAFIGHDEDGRRRLTAALRPPDKDYWEVFVPEAAPRAASAYEAFWLGEPVMELGAARSARVVLALGTSLWRGIPGFPAEYAHVVSLIRRRHVWIAWSYRGDDDAITASYDGLVRLDDGRWIWCPSPWLFIGDRSVVGRPSPATHWVD